MWRVFLFRVCSKVDAVLLSHPDVLHLGALTYAKKNLGLSAPVYLTEPVLRLGQLTMYDHYFCRKVRLSEIQLPSLFVSVSCPYRNDYGRL